MKYSPLAKDSSVRVPAHCCPSVYHLRLQTAIIRWLYPVLRHRSDWWLNEKSKCNVGSQTLREMQQFCGDERR